MLILLRWIGEEGGQFHTTDGRVIYRTIEMLERDYLPFTHNSPKGALKDIHIFVNKHYF